MRSTAIGTAATALLGAALFHRTVDAKCDTTEGEPEVSWDAGDNRLTLTSGCATMADLVDMRTVNGKNLGPVYHFSKDTNWYTNSYTGEYYLESDLYIENGATLSIDGTERERNECETLYLASNSSMIVNVRAYGGNLDIRYTKIFSWDLSKGDYDKLPEKSSGRSHINAITEKITGRTKDTCPDDSNSSNGQAKNNMGNARMDILRSEIGYLGYQGGEAYGLSWKARGLCKDHSNLDIFDDDNGLNVGVGGNIFRSDIHHNWFGHYSWGHDSGVWRRNKVHDNHRYGFDPHDDSDNLKIIGNEVYNNGWHGIIASKRCNNLVIKDNTVYNNGMNGIMLHRSSDYSTVRDNNVYGNGDAGLALFESSNNKVYDNIFSDNKYGIRFSNGANKNNVYDNIIKGSTKYSLYMYKGSDGQEAANNKDGHVKYNQIYSNDISQTIDHAWDMGNADSNVFRNNKMTGGSRAEFLDSRKNKIVGNEFPAGFNFVTDNSCFKAGSQATPTC